MFGNLTIGFSILSPGFSVTQLNNRFLDFQIRFFILDVKPKKIILIGDSAGGNLSIGNINLIILICCLFMLKCSSFSRKGLTFRCIQTGIRVPDGIVMAYPCKDSFII